VLFLTGHVPAYRVGAFAALHEAEGIEVALFGGSSLHGGAIAPGELPFPHRPAGAAEIARLAAGGGYRAVVCSTGGRLPLLAGWAGARAGRTPLLLWASLWAHPRSAAHALSYPPLRRLYGSADAVVTYGPHVSAYVSARGARNVHVAPQSVDNEFWSAAADDTPLPAGWAQSARARFLFVGRDVPEKGLDVLLAAWQGAAREGDSLALVGEHRLGEQSPHRAPGGDGVPDAVRPLGRLGAEQLRAVYAASDVLVVPSRASRTFREPWGLVVNEGMNAALAVIASDEVGAVAGGLVRDGETGLVVRAGDDRALAAAIARLSLDTELRGELGDAGRQAIRAYDHAAWARGFSEALASVGCSARAGPAAAGGGAGASEGSPTSAAAGG
jgi:glycosyltransferase involved in cell wall biosynthesis